MRSNMVNGQEFLPTNADLPAPVSMAMGNIPGTFGAGDIRANEQIILTAFHTLFLREHNRMAADFTAAGMNDEDAYNAARNLNIAGYQNIVYNEFLPGLLGSNMILPYAGYDDLVNAEVTLEFSTAMYRLGHSGVANDVLAVDSNDQQSVRTLADVFFAPQEFINTNDAVGSLLLGAKQTCHERMDPEMQDSLRRLLFANVLDETSDLGALNVERSRDHQLPSYNAVRNSLNLADATINSLSSLTCRQNDLNSMFNNIDEVPIFAAGLIEDPMGSSQLGQTLTAALVDQFSRFRDGDRFFFENTAADGPGFSPADLTQIRGTTLANVITQNTFVTANQIGSQAFQSDQCCFTGGNNSPNMMCVRSNGDVTLQQVDLCDVEDMTSAALAFYPGTTDPSNNVFYDCACVANVQIASAATASATIAIGVAAIAALFA